MIDQSVRDWGRGTEWNIWPEPHTGKYSSLIKDKVENWLHKQICSGAISPEGAQQRIDTDWRQYIPNAVQTKARERKHARYAPDLPLKLVR